MVLIKKSNKAAYTSYKECTISNFSVEDSQEQLFGKLPLSHLTSKVLHAIKWTVAQRSSVGGHNWSELPIFSYKVMKLSGQTWCLVWSEWCWVEAKSSITSVFSMYPEFWYSCLCCNNIWHSKSVAPLMSDTAFPVVRSVVLFFPL